MNHFFTVLQSLPYHSLLSSPSLFLFLPSPLPLSFSSSLLLFLSLSLPPFFSFSLFLFLPSPLSLSLSSSFLPPPPPLFLQMAASLEAKRKELQSQHKEELVRKQLQDVKQCLHASYSTGGRESYCSCPTVFMLGWWRSAPTQDYVDAYLNFVL